MISDKLYITARTGLNLNHILLERRTYFISLLWNRAKCCLHLYLL